jgi:hypothetical protein
MWDLFNFYPSNSKNCGECKMQFVSYEFNIFKVNDSTIMQMLIIQKMWKKKLTRLNINVGH